MQDVGRDLTPQEAQGKVEGFFNNTDNTSKLGGLVEDIRDAMVEMAISWFVIPVVLCAFGAV